MLAAIMFTDMIGYTALMQEDEEKAIGNRERHKNILQRSIADHGGEILQYYGDGTLSIFGSAIEAVECAIEIQNQLQIEPKIPLRIGIHTGDIVYDDEGIYGDGVNIASRIEGLATSGSVLISEKLYDEVKNHKGFNTVSLGRFELKNVKKPLEVFAINNNGLSIPHEKDFDQTEDLKSIAVLPFVNMSTDQENEYFSDGITEELLNVLAKMEGLQVTARTSSFAFKGRNVNVKEIGKQLGARHIVEGSVRKSGNKVRITAQLVNTSDGFHLWSETYDRQLDDIFAIQDEISSKIANTLREKLTLKQDSRINPPTQNMDAYNFYLKGMFYANKWTTEDSQYAIDNFEKALQLEPEFALPYAQLASLNLYLAATGKESRNKVLPVAKKFALKALELDDKAVESYEALANFYFFYEWDWDRVLELADKGLRLNPSYAGIHLIQAMVHMILEEYDEAIESIEKAVMLDPFSAPVKYAYAAVLFHAGKIEQTLLQLDNLFTIAPYFPDAISLRGFSNQVLGNLDEAEKLFVELSEIPGYGLQSIGALGGLECKRGNIVQAEKYLEKLLEAEKDNIENGILAQIAFMYLNMDKPDQMFHYFGKSLAQKDTYLIYLRCNPQFRKYRDDPRYEELLKKINLL